MPHKNFSLREDFGCDVFSDDVMKQRLSQADYTALKRTMDGAPLAYETANAVAEAMKDWAIEKGATHFTHWFQPMTGLTAEKHESFLSGMEGGKAILTFSGKALIKGETDGSSFPSGGLRETFEARGYTTWDCTSPAFVKRDEDGNCLLCIPTAFCSFTGEALDEKTPLLRSMEALSTQAVRVLHHLGQKDVRKVTPTVGGEQEYFLIDEKLFKKRKDLVYTGRTLYGAAPARGQELDDHYYSTVDERTSRFMRELNFELWRLGVPAQTQHNEAAPSQFELVPLYMPANISVDNNQLIMELLQKVAARHGYVCLLHEKPYDGVNGSGKHNNWSLKTDTGLNLLKPGKNPVENDVFLTFFIAALAAVDEYASVLRMACASPGNELRLGGNEAPPAILSAFIGNPLLDMLEKLEQGERGAPQVKEKMTIGVSTLAVMHKDFADRNRTSPFAFTGNKFEFRMVGSSQSLGMPNTALNTIVAEKLREIADALDADQAKDTKTQLKGLLRELIAKHKRVIFNGNNYAKEWLTEAKRRGMPILSSAVDAFDVMAEPKVVELFTRHGVLNGAELGARREIALVSYVKHIKIEAVTMLKLARQKLLPAAVKYSKLLAEALQAIMHTAVADGDVHAELLKNVCSGLSRLRGRIQTLEAALKKLDGYIDAKAQAQFCRDTLLLAMAELRAVADELEKIVDKEIWPLPSYGEMLFNIV